MSRLRYFAFTLIISLSLLSKFSAGAQSPSVDSLLIRALATDELLPMMIDSAIKYSPQARMSRSNENLANANFQINKKALYKAINIQTSYGYGTNYSAVNNQSAVIGNNFTTAQSANYNVGIGLQIPLTQIINSKNIRKMEQSKLDVAVADKDKTALLIKQDVIRLYQDFKLIQKLMRISYANLQSAIINNTLAEKNFINGQISVEQASTVQGNYNNAVIAYETYVNSFQTSYMQLEAYIGTSLSSLISNLK